MGQIKLNDISYSGGGGSAVTELEDLDNVSITTPSNGQVLKYNGTSQEWENQAAAEVDSLSELDDVDLTLLADGDILVYNSTTQRWENMNPILVPWSSGTDEQIARMLNAYYADEITLQDVKSVWSVGDSRIITLSAMTATGVGESHRSQQVEMQILDFEHDDLTTSINGHTKALITTQQKNCLRDATVADDDGVNNTEHGYINSTNTNVNGWRGCARRTWCNNVYYNALPSGIKSLVKQANHITSTGNQQTTTEVTADYCFLPSEWEIFGTKTYAAVQEGTQYSYYTTAANRYKLPNWSSSYVSDIWWERSPYGSNSTHFCTVDADGGAGNTDASNARGLAPSFCL